MAKRRNSRRDREYVPLNVGALQQRSRRIEFRGGREYTVQPIRAERAQKHYVCPGCHGDVPPGQAHIAAWRADDIFGDDAALAERRHWHTRCWSLA